MWFKTKSLLGTLHGPVLENFLGAHCTSCGWRCLTQAGRQSHARNWKRRKWNQLGGHTPIPRHYLWMKTRIAGTKIDRDREGAKQSHLGVVLKKKKKSVCSRMSPFVQIKVHSRWPLTGLMHDPPRHGTGRGRWFNWPPRHTTGAKSRLESWEWKLMGRALISFLTSM